MKNQISVILSIKNESDHLMDCLRSILNQKGVDVDVIVIDDHSDDDSYEIAVRYSKEDSRIRVYRNNGIGKVSAFNQGVAIKLFQNACLFGGDDLMPQNSLAKRVEFIDSLKIDGPVVVFSKIQIYSPHSNRHNEVLPKSKNKGAEIGGAMTLNDRAIKKIFPIPIELPNEDTWLKISASYLNDVTVFHYPEVVCLWRFHSGNTSGYGANYEVYNEKYTQRMKAFKIFKNENLDNLKKNKIDELSGVILCEDMRLEKKIFKLLMCDAPFVFKLRTLAMYNEVAYNFKWRFIRIFSGWAG